MSHHTTDSEYKEVRVNPSLAAKDHYMLEECSYHRETLIERLHNIEEISQQNFPNHYSYYWNECAAIFDGFLIDGWGDSEIEKKTKILEMQLESELNNPGINTTYW